VIRGFAARDTEKIFKGRHSHRLPVDIQRRAKTRLDRIDAAVSIDDLRIPPSHHLEKLAGDREGQYSIRINDQWRICFRWDGGDAYDAEITDYH
jgi:proteic killer suppression protein